MEEKDKMKIYALGGYSEIGRSMTGIVIGDDALILDCGLNVDKVVTLQEAGKDVDKLPVRELYAGDVVADDREFFKEHGNKVRAIIIGHAHLDHCGAVSYLANKYDCPIIATPFTLEVIKQKASDLSPKEAKGKTRRLRLSNRLVQLNAGSTYKVNDGLSIEFIYATHSTPQTVMVCLHTVEGNVVYAVDWKFDEYPIIGKRTDYNRLKQLGKEGIKLVFSDSTRVDRESRTHSESLVREMLRDVLLWTDIKGRALITTTFASHIARLTTLVNFAKKLKRIPVLIGRSMYNYVTAAERAGICRITRSAIVVKPRDNNRMLKKIAKEKDRYMIITTGHQGEPNAMLVGIANGVMPLKLQPNDVVVFCSETIPSPVNQANRSILEKKLKARGVRLFKDVHVSGHAAKEDLRTFLEMLKPEHFIPTHGGLIKLSTAVQLANELSYELGRTVHLLQNGQKLEV